ncbi:hypothetical protein [Microbacterium sp. AK031]|uniref:hypothetical protein n=1 Tax=Microbacterium sp. AK031 TaxID=2723076 RepID=UPI0021682A85|nr:hypothetical protein [Microbacterium sp. AK031]MCS3844170.1 hypothetical protein [Microbacterium sp. AK031]
MQIIDTLAVVGEAMSWIGLGIGIPLLIVAGMVALAEGHWERVDIAVVERDGAAIARWFARGDFHERPLRGSELTAEEWHSGYVSAKNPENARIHPPMGRRLLLTLGIIFTIAGIVGFVVSFVPAFV